MIRPRIARAVILIGLILSAANVAEAGLIPIVNAGFEESALGDGDFTDGVDVPGWRLDAGRGGAFNPTAVEYPGEAPEGQNIGWSAGGTLSQTLITVLQPGVYTLKFDVGNSFLIPFPGYIVDLYVGRTILARDDSTLHPADGTFLTSTIQYTATASDLNLGQSLSIRFISVGSETDFDNFRLDFEPAATGAVPEPASVATLGIGLLCLAGHGWRKCRKGGHAEPDALMPSLVGNPCEN